MNIRNYIIIGMISLIATGISTSVCYATTGDYIWGSYSSGDAVCAEYGRTCVSAYNSLGNPITCSATTGSSSGSAFCSSTVTGGTTWINYSSGSAECAPLGRACTAAYNSLGSSIGCSATTGSSSGTALCGATVTAGVTWVNYSSGSASCSEIGRTCTAAYGSLGAALASCSTTTGSSSGTALCGATVTAGETWVSYSSGNAACAPLGRTCTAAYGSLGDQLASCLTTTGSSSGSALCGATVTGGVTWISYSSGSAACAPLGRTCTAAYGSLGAQLASCSTTTGSSSGSALCGETVTAGATWASGTWSSGSASCAVIGRTCTIAYRTDGTSSTCAASTSGGIVLCEATVTAGTIWASGTWSSGSAACAKIGRTCTTAYRTDGTSSTCAASTSGGSTLCADVVTAGAAWPSGTWSTGNAACTSVGRTTCIAAYKIDGTSSSCGTSTSGGSALCGATITEGATWWTAGTWSSGNAACAKIGRTCNTAYKIDGTSSTCAASTSGGTALCGATVTAGVTWISYSTGNAACAKIGRTCTTSYRSDTGAALASCSTGTGSGYGGVALCGATVTVGATWISYFTGNAACASIGSTCTTSYRSDTGAVLASCSTATTSYGGVALCSGNQMPLATWVSYSTGNATCASIGYPSCIVAYRSDTGAALASCSTGTTSYGGIVLCGGTHAAGTTWSSYSSGSAACAKIGTTCTTAYRSDTGAVLASCSTATTTYGGIALCNTEDLEKFGYSWASDVSKSGNSGCASGEFDFGECLSAYNNNGVLASCPTINSGGSALCKKATRVITKSLQWNDVKSDILAYFWNRWTDSGWSFALGQRDVAITYNIGVKDKNTSAIINDGDSVTVGTQLVLSFVPHYYTDIYWFGLGYSNDSPYGEWRAGATPPSTISCLAKDFVGNYVNTCHGTDYDVYIPLVVSQPTKTITNTTGMSCGALTGGEGIGYSMECTVTGTGQLNPLFNFGSTFGKFYYRYVDSSGCYGNDISLESTVDDIFYGCNMLGHFSNSYSLVVPAQTIPYTLTALVNGACGTANKTYPAGSTAFGSYTLCSAGTSNPASPVFPTILSPTTTWVCNGLNGGTTSPTCTASLTVNGACGTANKTYPAGSTAFGSYTLCSAGTSNPASPVFPTIPSPTTTWVCNGLNGGAVSSVCTATLTPPASCVLTGPANVLQNEDVNFTMSYSDMGSGTPTFATQSGYPICGDGAVASASSCNSSGACTFTCSNYTTVGNSYAVSARIENGVNSATCQTLINVTPQHAPSVSSLQKFFDDYCSGIFARGDVFFRWTYQDVDNDNENRFDLQIDNNSTFLSPEVDRRYCNISSAVPPSPRINEQTVPVISSPVSSPRTYCAGNPDQYIVDTPDVLTYNATYYWRVRVYSAGLTSGWVTGSSFTTAPHYYPYPSFTISPSTTVTAGQRVTFTSGSLCDPPCICSWSFGDDTTGEGNTVTHTYTKAGNYQAVLTVSDGTFVCDTDGIPMIVNSSAPRTTPEWREIAPF